MFFKIKRININKLNLRYKNLEVRFKNVLVKCGKKIMIFETKHTFFLYGCVNIFDQ
jgi:hypothetical protein